MEPGKKISVITINLNNVAGLRATMDSVRAQDFDDFEYLVIDGNSTDGSRRLVEERISETDYFISEPDKGIYEAMNKAVVKAKGDYLLFINSGDRLYSADTLRRAAKHLGEHDIVYGNLKIEDQGKLSDGFMPDRIDLAQMMRDTLWHPVSFIRHSLFTRYGLFDTRYKICGDYEFFFRTIIAKKATTLHIDQFIAIFGLQGLSSDSSNAGLIRQEKEMAQRTYLGDDGISAFTKKEDNRKTGWFSKWFR